MTPPKYEIIPVPRWADSPELLRLAGIQGHPYEIPTIRTYGDASSLSESASNTSGNESDTSSCYESSQSTERPVDESARLADSKRHKNVSTKHSNAATIGKDEGENDREENSSTSLGKRARRSPSPGLESDDAMVVRRRPKIKLMLQAKIVSQK